MRVAVLGANGQLGTDVVRAFKETGAYDVLPLTHAEIELMDSRSVQSVLLDLRPQAVINCAAFHRVDECEQRPLDAFRVNAVGALSVARACAELEALCLYVSTDYVFDGEKVGPYTEDDPPRPINVYGVSKLAGELFVQQACPRWIVARVAGLYGRAGPRGKSRNFVETILSKARAGETLRVVNDIRMSPTYTHDAAHALESLVRASASGTYHVVNVGVCTWYEFAGRALELAGVSASLQPIAAQQYSSSVRRPINSALESVRINGAIRSWSEALKAYLVEMGHARS